MRLLWWSKGWQESNSPSSWLSCDSFQRLNLTPAVQLMKLMVEFSLPYATWKDQQATNQEAEARKVN